MTKRIYTQTPRGRFLPLVTRPGGKEHERGVILPPNVPPDLTGTTPDGGTATVTPTGIVINWTGKLPQTASTTSAEVFVPYDVDGSSLTFTLNQAYARISSTYTSNTNMTVQKSAGGQAAFSATTVTTLSVTTGNYEATPPTFTSTVTSGQVLRVIFTAVGADTNVSIQVEGERV